MSRKTTVVITVCAVLLGLSMAGASLYSSRSIPIATAVVVAQAIPAQIGGLQVCSPQIAGIDSVKRPPIHVTIAGTPMAGTYLAHGNPPPRANSQGWRLDFTGGPGSPIQGHVNIWRDIDPVTGIATAWGADAGCGIPSATGACIGHITNGQTFGGFMDLVGPDFNVSGTSTFVGDQAFGGGGNVTISVAP